MNTLTLPRLNKWFWGVPLAVLLVGAAAHGIMMLVPPPADLDLSRTQTSALGTFVASVDTGELKLGDPMSWTFAVNDADGNSIDATELRVDGGMPLHGHGLPSAPSEPQLRSDGQYEVDGIRFTMSGWWVVKLHRATPQGDDVATFNFTM
jgi:hypothetical protein